MRSDLPVGLDPHLDPVLEGMRRFVPCEPNFIILQKLHSCDIPQCVVFQVDVESSCELDSRVDLVLHLAPALRQGKQFM